MANVDNHKTTLPINELISGAISVSAVVGTVVLAFANRPIPTPLIVILTASVPYYMAARSYNTGYSHAEEAAKAAKVDGDAGAGADQGKGANA